MARALTRRTAAPGQYRGYSLQATRVLYHLLHAEQGTTVSLEVFADVGISRADGRAVAEEDKSRVRRSNPLADRAVDLWKTFRNWVEAAEAGTLVPARTRYRIYTPKRFSAPVVEAFNQARTVSDARAALASAKSRLSGWSRSKRTAANLGDHAAVVFGANPDLVATIVQNFETESGSGDQIADLQSALRQKFVPADVLDGLLLMLLGWVKSRLDALIDNGQPAHVCFDQFSAEYQALYRKLDTRQILVSLARPPADTSVREHLATRTYVRQLDLIEIDDDEKLRAITDYLKAEVDRIDWAARGRVHSSSFDELQDDLISIWTNYRRRVLIESSDRASTEKGGLIYSACCLHTVLLQGVPVPGHFARGSFHFLADHEAIGWHPLFKDLLAPTAAAHGSP